MLPYWLQRGCEGSIGHRSLPFAASLALALRMGPVGIGLVPLTALLLALQQPGTLLKDLVLKGTYHTDEVLHVLQIHLAHTPLVAVFSYIWPLS